MSVETDTDWRGNLFCIRDRTKELYARQCWADVSFAILDENGQPKEIIKAHKVILANASEVFEKMFFGSIPEDTSLDIPIDDITPETFSAMMKYIYTDEVAVDSWQNVAELFCVAKKYMLHALVQHCVECLMGFLTSANALEIYEFADFHESQYLVEAALKIFRNETFAVIRAPFFKNIKLTTLAIIVEQETLNVGETVLFKAVESLAEHKGVIKGTRKDPSYNSGELLRSPEWVEFHEIVKKIQFLSMTDKMFKNEIGYSGLLLPDEAFAISVCLSNRDNINSDYPKDFVQRNRQISLTRIFFDITMRNSPIGRIVMELRSDVVPGTAEKVRSVYTGQKSIDFKKDFFIEDFDRGFCIYLHKPGTTETLPLVGRECSNIKKK